MSQSSLLTWLNKPGAVKTASPPPPPPPPPPLPPPATPPATAASPDNHRISNSARERDGQERVAGDTTIGLRPLPPNVELRACTKHDIPHLKRLTSLLLPIPYADKFFKETIDDPVTASITLLAVWHDDPSLSGSEKGRLVGAIRCRLLASSTISHASHDNDADAPMLYLSTLVLLSPYRQHGIATHLLRTLTRRAVHDYGVRRIGAHVWEANSDALAWYRKRGFREIGRDPAYYRRLHPQTAIILERKVGVTDLLGT
jgi:ribosomal protein S18 acetylase RimI-like enzyme